MCRLHATKPVPFRRGRFSLVRAVFVCLGVGLCATAAMLRAQATDPKISSAPGGVPVPAPPALPATIPVDASPLSSVYRIHVVDGRNGEPVEHAHLRLWYDERSGAAFSLVTDAAGVALLPAPVGTPVRLFVTPDDRVDCRRAQSASTDPLPAIGLSSLAASGAVTANHCGRLSEKPRPGELVLFVRPLRWYEGFNRP